jgi:hypothetical protein
MTLLIGLIHTDTLNVIKELFWRKNFTFRSITTRQYSPVEVKGIKSNYVIHKFTHRGQRAGDYMHTHNDM